MSTQRPTVTVVVPFVGSDDQLAALRGSLNRLQLAPGDRVVIADNRRHAGGSPAAVGRADTGNQLAVIAAAGIATPGFARNRGAADAETDWLVFIDADTRPEADLLERYFSPPPLTDTGILAGGIIDVLPDPVDGAGAAGAPGTDGRAESSLSARHAVERKQMAAEVTADRGAFSYAQSANCAIRRDAFVGAGGFDQHARAGEDADLCFRLYQAGYRMELRPQAAVTHTARATLRASLRQLVHHGAGAAWCERQHPGSFPSPGAYRFSRRIARGLLTSAQAARKRDRQRAGFALLDAVEACAFQLGRSLNNRKIMRP